MHKQGRGKERESSQLHTECEARGRAQSHNPVVMTWAETKSCGHLTNWAFQAPHLFCLFKLTIAELPYTFRVAKHWKITWIGILWL